MAKKAVSRFCLDLYVKSRNEGKVRCAYVLIDPWVVLECYGLTLGTPMAIKAVASLVG